MKQTVPQLTFGFHAEKPIRATFTGPEISSDGGLLLLRQIDDDIQLCKGFVAALEDNRQQAKVQHSHLEQVRQRLYQIVCGYEDQNDATSLRHDPMFKLVCENDAALASQPTLSRLENTITGRELNRLRDGLEQRYVDSLPADTPYVILDIDSTDDPTHGHQQLTLFHGYYDHYMYHPLLVFDGQSGQLITASLRPGNAHSSKGACSMLRRVIRRIKERFPKVPIVIRGDAHFGIRRVLEAVEQLTAQYPDVRYVFGIAKNDVLLQYAEGAMAYAKFWHEEVGQSVQHFTGFYYAAQSWGRHRRIVCKAEHMSRGANPRFVVTNMPNGLGDRAIYWWYCQRGACENMIKDFKNDLHGDRLSCSSFVANAFRLYLHCAAYRLLHELRDRAGKVHPDYRRKQMNTIRLKLLKIGAVVKKSVRRFWVQLPESYPYIKLFAGIAHMQPGFT